MAKTSVQPPKNRADKLKAAFRLKSKPEDASELEDIVRIMRKKK